MFFKRTEVMMTWLASASLGAVLGLLLYRGLDLPSRTPLLAGLIAVVGMVSTSLVAYGLRRFLLPRNLKETTK